VLPSDPAAAKRYARRILVRYPDTDAAPTADLGLVTADLSDRERLDRAKILMSRFHYVEAREELRRLTDHRTLAGEARWLVGVIGLQKLRDDPAEARAMLERVAASPGPNAEDALMGVVRTWVKEDRYEDAMKVADSYLRRYPSGKHRAAIAYYRGWLPYDQRRCDEAVPALRSYVTSYGDRSSYVRGFIAWCAIREEKWEQAIRDYEVLVNYGGALTRGKAWYWQGVALDALGRREEARAKFARIRQDYPLTWYDILAQQRLARWDGRDPRASTLPWPDGGGAALLAHPLSADALSWPRLSGRTATAFARVRRLVALGEVNHARAAYGPIRTAVQRAVAPERRDAFIRAMADAVEDYKHGWELASGGRLGGMWELDEPSSARWLMGYPRAYRPLVEHLGAIDGVLPEFIYSIMRQESRYHPSMVSAMDAVGALQMIFPTAEQVANERGLHFDPVSFADPPGGLRLLVALHGAPRRHLARPARAHGRQLQRRPAAGGPLAAREPGRAARAAGRGVHLQRSARLLPHGRVAPAPLSLALRARPGAARAGAGPALPAGGQLRRARRRGVLSPLAVASARAATRPRGSRRCTCRRARASRASAAPCPRSRPR
jgi:tetratricopeptide (TPR) repeat protein